MTPLDAMADVLRRDGWIRLQSEGPEGRCLLGAWKHIYQFGPFSSQECFDALNALRDVCADLYNTGLVVEVNDNHCDSVEDAIAICQKAAARFSEVHG